MTSLNPVLTCGYQVSEVMRVHLNQSKKESKINTIKLFEEVDLPRPTEIFKSYPHQLSGGQKQRVMIAMAIACSPDLLIADEPTTALDVSVQGKILQLLIDLKDKYNMGIIFISHDLGVISKMADNIVVMNKGEIVESGATKKILTSPSNIYTKGLLACISGLKNKDERLPVVDDFSNKSEKLSSSAKDDSSKIIVSKRSDTEPNVILEVKNLKTYYNTESKFLGKSKSIVKAVDNVSFNVFEGETLGLVGESGCGKTSLGRTILQLIEATDGSVKYRGVELNKLKKKELRKFRKKIQIIFQDPYSSLNPRISIGDAILEPMLAHGITNRKNGRLKVMELLESVGLDTAFYNRYPHEFSGGQRQRIGIARALGLNPEFIVCDESISALVVSFQAQVLNLLNDLKRDYSLTYIFISHDLNVVRYMSDRIIIMKDGKIIESGNSQKIFVNPESDYTKMLIDSIPVIL